jgi:hypothetical protein
MHQPKQLQLFEILIQPEIKAIYDPYWDEITKSDNVGEQLHSEDSPCNSVGEQVTPDTLKVAHQHDAQLYLPHTEEIFTHWVERYWVERGTKKYWYYRYTWMEGRKLHRVYIGSITSNKAKAKKQAAEYAILDGQSPHEIKQLIRGFKVCPHVPLLYHCPKLS